MGWNITLAVFPTLANSILPNRIFKTISSPILEKFYCSPKQLKNTLKKKNKCTKQCLSENTAYINQVVMIKSFWV